MAEPFVPDIGIEYPEKLDGRMVPIKAVRNVIVDEHYPFLNTTITFKIKRLLIYLVICTLMVVLAFFRFGLRIEGKKILRRHRRLLKDGAMTVANHVHRWDFPFVVQAVCCRTMYFPVWKEQLNGSDAGLIRGAGGIPIPDGISTIKFFNKAFDEIRARKKWIHF